MVWQLLLRQFERRDGVLRGKRQRLLGDFAALAGIARQTKVART